MAEDKSGWKNVSKTMKFAAIMLLIGKLHLPLAPILYFVVGPTAGWIGLASYALFVFGSAAVAAMHWHENNKADRMQRAWDVLSDEAKAKLLAMGQQ